MIALSVQADVGSIKPRGLAKAALTRLHMPYPIEGCSLPATALLAIDVMTGVVLWLL